MTSHPSSGLLRRIAGFLGPVFLLLPPPGKTLTFKRSMEVSSVK